MRQSLIYLGAWLWRSGMGLSAVLLFVFALLVIHLGITRIVVQTGLVFVRATMSAQSFTTSLLGTASLSSATLTSLTVSFSWTHTVFLFMPALAHAVKLHCDLKLNRRHVIAAILSAFAVAAPVSIYVTLALGYELGAENFKGWAFMYGKSAHYESIVAKMRLPAGVDWPAAVQYALGGIVMWLLLQLTYRVPRWPVHPIGLTIGYTHPTAVMAFSVLLTWAVKSLIMSIGGRPLYEKAKPLFLGLIVGYLAGVGVALVVDLVCFGPGQGHPIYSL